MLLPDREEDVRAQGFGGLRVARFDTGDVLLHGRVEGLGEHDVLLELAHGLPQPDPLGLQRRVVAPQFVLAAAQRADDPVQGALGGGVLGDVVAQPVAAGQPRQELAALRRGQVARVQVLHHAPQLHQGARHPGLGVAALVGQAAHRAFQHAVGLGGRGAHLGGTEAGDLADLAGELGRAGVERGESVHVGGGLAGQVRAGRVVEGHEAAGPLARYGGHGLERGESECEVVVGAGHVAVSPCAPLVFRCWSGSVRRWTSAVIRAP